MLQRADKKCFQTLTITTYRMQIWFSTQDSNAAKRYVNFVLRSIKYLSPSSSEAVVKKINFIETTYLWSGRGRGKRLKFNRENLTTFKTSFPFCSPIRIGRIFNCIVRLYFSSLTSSH